MTAYNIGERISAIGIGVKGEIIAVSIHEIDGAYYLIDAGKGEEIWVCQSEITAVYKDRD